MVSFWARTDRIATSLSEGEREQRDMSRAQWVDASSVAVFPTLAPKDSTRAALARDKLRSLTRVANGDVRCIKASGVIAVPATTRARSSKPDISWRTRDASDGHAAIVGPSRGQLKQGPTRGS
jgi:hypothetical protein